MILFCINLLISAGKSDSIDEYSNNNIGKKITDIIDVSSIESDFPIAAKFGELLESIEIPESDCYSRVIRQISSSCDELSEKEKIFLSLKFTHCYYNLTNRLDEFPTSYPEEEQVEHMSEKVYSIYKMLSLHIVDMCFWAMQSVLNEETASSLLSLFKKVVDSSQAIKDLNQDFNESSSSLLKTVDEIQADLENGSILLSRLIGYIHRYQGTLNTYQDFVRNALENIRIVKFYGLMLCLAIVIGTFLPEIILPAIISTIVLFFVDRAMCSYVVGWENSSLRNVLVYLLIGLYSAYPFKKFVSWIYVFIFDDLKSLFRAATRSKKSGIPNVSIPGVSKRTFSTNSSGWNRRRM